ncbi:MAG: phospholipase D-like domain-containing protein [Candidatus Methanomethylicaceae archaeon]
MLSLFLELSGLLLALGMTLYLIGKRKEPQTILAWSLSFFLFPFLGPLLYLLFGETRMEKYVRTRRSPTYIYYPEETGPRYIPDHPLHYYASRVVLATQGFPPRPGNALKLYTNGEAFFTRMYGAFAEARTSIHVMFYLIRDDATGREFLEILEQKAREGVKVRLLYDYWGSLGFHFSRLRREFKGKILMAPFLPLVPWKPTLNLNFRNHRKIAVVDHTLAFTGGINIADEYRVGIWEGVPWHDLGVEVQGPAVRDLEQIFAEDWLFSTGEALELKDFPPPLPEGTPIQVVAGGPDHRFEPLSHLLTTILSRCNKEATLITPYFIPDTPLLHTFSTLVLRGVKVNLIVPEVGNHYWVQRASESYYRDLLAMGIQPWKFEPGMIHTKLFLSDGLLSLVGSPNLDIRSLKLNFEVALLLFAPRDLAEVQRVVEEVMEHASPLTLEEYSSWGLPRRILNGIARVMSPVF